MALALLAAALRYGFDLDIGLMLVPSIALILLMATSIGFAIAHAVPHPS